MDHAHGFEFTDTAEMELDDYVAVVPAGLTSTESLMQVLYNALELPGYFGFNWNALSDCLRDFHWLRQHSVVLRHADLPAIPTTDLRTYLEVLSDAERSWRPGSLRRRVMLLSSLGTLIQGNPIQG